MQIYRNGMFMIIVIVHLHASNIFKLEKNKKTHQFARIPTRECQFTNVYS